MVVIGLTLQGQEATLSHPDYSSRLIVTYHQRDLPFLFEEETITGKHLIPLQDSGCSLYLKSVPYNWHILIDPHIQKWATHYLHLWKMMWAQSNNFPFIFAYNFFNFYVM